MQLARRISLLVAVSLLTSGLRDPAPARQKWLRQRRALEPAS